VVLVLQNRKKTQLQPTTILKGIGKTNSNLADFVLQKLTIYCSITGYRILHFVFLVYFCYTVLREIYASLYIFKLITAQLCSWDFMAVIIWKIYRRSKFLVCTTVQQIEASFKVSTFLLTWYDQISTQGEPDNKCILREILNTVLLLEKKNVITSWKHPEKVICQVLHCKSICYWLEYIVVGKKRKNEWILRSSNQILETI
jgi:hypothetical protein